MPKCRTPRMRLKQGWNRRGPCACMHGGRPPPAALSHPRRPRKVEGRYWTSGGTVRAAPCGLDVTLAPQTNAPGSTRLRAGFDLSWGPTDDHCAHEKTWRCSPRSVGKQEVGCPHHCDAAPLWSLALSFRSAADQPGRPTIPLRAVEHRQASGTCRSGLPATPGSPAHRRRRPP